MRSAEDIRKEIEDLKKKTLSNRESEENKQVYRDKIKALTMELRNINGIEKKIVPVETNNIIANRTNPPRSKFISSAAYRV